MLNETVLDQSLPAGVRRDLAAWRDSVHAEMVYLRDVGGRSYRIVKGERIRREKAGSIYCFDMESELFLAEDAPIMVDVDKKSVRGVVVACEDFQITLSLQEDIGERVTVAYIRAEPWKLLEALNERLKLLNPRDHPLAVQLMQEGPALATSDPIAAVETGQTAAKEHVWNDSITVIWGPPGTGKTHTMAEIAIRHIVAGRSVLAVSHSNVSVDGIVLKVAELMREHGYEKLIYNAQVLRFGHVRDETLDADEDLVAHRYALSCNPDLKDELDDLVARRAELRKEGVRTSNELVDIQKRINQIRKVVNEDEMRSVERARFVATTASKMYANKFFEGRQYDLVLFDEVSMAYVPQIICAAMHARQRLVLVGDFRQLAPIATCPGARDSLSRDVFSYLGITDRSQKAHYHPWLVMLDEQRRMHPAISAFSSEAFYDHLLKDHASVVHARDGIAASKPCPGSSMTLVDSRGAYCASASNADHSRFNILGAIMSFGLALAAAEDGRDSIGIIAPYIAQVRLIRAMIQDYQERRRKNMADLADVACSTVHQFQGSERDVIVLDTVESYPAKKPGVLTYKNTNGSVDRLVNVAVTRARGKLLAVANENFWDARTAGEGNAFGALCRHLRCFDTTITARSGALGELFQSLDLGPNMVLFSEDAAEQAFFDDIGQASKRIVFSFPDGKLDEPFATRLYHAITSARVRGVEVLAKCCDYSDISEDWKTFTWQSDDALFPLVVLDGSVCWYGMPPSRMRPPIKDGVGPVTTLATPIRISGYNTVNMIWSLANLEVRKADGMAQALRQRNGTTKENDDGRGSYGLSGYIKENVKCPSCHKPMALARSFKKGTFYLKCTACGKVDFLTPELANHYFSVSGARCPKCRSTLVAKVSKYGFYIKCDGAARHTVQASEV